MIHLHADPTQNAEKATELALVTVLMDLKAIRLTTKKVAEENVNQTTTAQPNLHAFATSVLTLASELAGLTQFVKSQIISHFVFVLLDTLAIRFSHAEKFLLHLHLEQIRVCLHPAAQIHNVEKSITKQSALVCLLILEALLDVVQNVLLTLSAPHKWHV